MTLRDLNLRIQDPSLIESECLGYQSFASDRQRIGGLLVKPEGLTCYIADTTKFLFCGIQIAVNHF